MSENETPRTGKLHEVLAVEADLRGQSSKVLNETKARFQRPDVFKGSITSYKPFDEAEMHNAEESHEELATTVPDRLRFTAEALTRYWDAVLQKETTNQKARADIVVDNQTIASGVPATMLLGLETKIREFRDAISSMPTLDAKTAWEKVDGDKPGVFRQTHADVNFRGAKVQQPLVLSPATEHHPAQVEMVTKDVRIGKVTKTNFSGAVTSARASEILSRTDRLLRAVKEARQRANMAPVESGTIGAALFSYILVD